ncbi:hypothetical protein FB567DRAFT_596711 [Paraphoma chrysanthemicola]|uniref:Uncharacterized protein n=1 Tax=Paraphoma chrysanthemicola TaxID=798071 RepID=A0A8K0QYD3_9PLEO|nr:hypothetical protein FB567DRAFT_596711 [Paraphoma chrysanthemicola]
MPAAVHLLVRLESAHAEKPQVAATQIGFDTVLDPEVRWEHAEPIASIQICAGISRSRSDDVTLTVVSRRISLDEVLEDMRESVLDRVQEEIDQGTVDTNGYVTMSWERALNKAKTSAQVHVRHGFDVLYVWFEIVKVDVS